MATAKEYLAKAASYIGIEGTDNIFNTWYWGFHCYDPNIYPWCAAFQSYIGVHDLDMDFKASASAAGVANQGDRVRPSDVKPGDWVLFNWDGRQTFGWADHIGVVEWTDISATGLFGTIEGNTGNSAGGAVERCTRTVNSGYAVAFFRPPYKEIVPKQIPGSTSNNKGFKYTAHVQNVGWCPPVRDGQVAGTTGYSLRLEALKFDPPEGVKLTVKVHIQDEGWKIYKGIEHGNSIVIGTTGKSLRLEAIEIESNKPLEYRVHQQNVGWKGWTPSGFPTGSDGQSARLEAIQVRMV